MFPLPAEAPPTRGPLQVCSIGVGVYADGLYDVTTMGTYEGIPTWSRPFAAPRLTPDGRGPQALLEQSDAVLVGAAGITDAAVADRLNRDFKIAVAYPGLTIHVRQLPRP
jgi:hypothetical protein